MAAAREPQQSPRQRAQAQAAALLSAFARPPRATRLPAAPDVSGGVLRHAAFTSGDPDIASAVSWWHVPGSAQAVLSYESTHLPRGFKLSGQGAIGSAATPVTRAHPVPAGGGQFTPRPLGSAYGAWFESWSPPGGGGELTVEIADPASGQAYVRVYADVPWVPARPASERVPAGVSVVVITARPDMNSPRDIPGPVTVTDQARVRQIVALADGLSLDTGAIHGCPLETGKGITVTFLARAGGPALATASEPVPSCGSVSFGIGGKDQPTLSDWGAFTQDVLKAAGVKWAGWNA